jgi:hypothetical protein
LLIIAVMLCAMQIYCGFDKMIRVFDTGRPGRDHIDQPTIPNKWRHVRAWPPPCVSTQSPPCLCRRSKGQKGIISTIAFNPDRSGMYAAGSYSRSVGLYSEGSKRAMCLLDGANGGITHVWIQAVSCLSQTLVPVAAPQECSAWLLPAQWSSGSRR